MKLFCDSPGGLIFLLHLLTTIHAQVHYLAITINVQVSQLRFRHAVTNLIAREQKLKVFQSEVLRRIFQP
jgi:hypothetical protein